MINNWLTFFIDLSIIELAVGGDFLVMIFIFSFFAFFIVTKESLSSTDYCFLVGLLLLRLKGEEEEEGIVVFRELRSNLYLSCQLIFFSSLLDNLFGVLIGFEMLWKVVVHFWKVKGLQRLFFAIFVMLWEWQVAAIDLLLLYFPLFLSYY